MPNPTPARGTQTTLRALPKALIVGRAGSDAAALSQALEGEGYLTGAMPEYGQALASLRAQRRELVVLDAAMPTDAVAFLAALRADAALADLPVLVTSATDDIAALEQCLAAGADDCLPHLRVGAALDRRLLREGQDLRREMAVARNIQRDFLPESLPQLRGVEIEAALRPAKQVSGDFYDAFVLSPSGNLVLVLGDVCDKGVGAALFMALFRSLIRASADPVGGGAIQMIGGRRTLVMQSLEAASPADLLTRVAGFTNNYIARLHGRTNMFATVFLAVIDPDYGRLDYLNAGHEPALIVAPDGSVRELRPTGPALGMMPDMTFTSVSGQLERGEHLVAFTDGLVEAHSVAGEVYGGDRLRATLRQCAPGTATELVNGVLEALSAFTEHAEPHDDLTMLAVKRPD
jgi:serine phosphatase RsbU (regulator of sigma subunit)